MDPSNLKLINDMQAEKTMSDQRHQEMVTSGSRIQGTIIDTTSSLIRYLEGHTTKTEVVNQLSEIGTPDVFKVVEALNALHDTLKTHENTDLTEITKVMQNLLDEAKQIPKELPEQKEQQFVDYTKQLSSLTDAVKAVEKVVKQQKLIAEAPVINVPEAIVHVDKPDLDPLQHSIRDVVDAVKGIIVPEYKTDNMGVEKLLKASNKLLKDLIDKPVGRGGGGGGGRATPYQDSSGIPAFVTLNAGAVPVSGTFTATLPSGASTSAKQDTGNTSLASIDSKITTVNTGAVVISSGSITANAGTNLNTSALALESGGNLSILAGGVSSSIYQTNLKQVGGVATQMGIGASGTGTQRVAISSDSVLTANIGTTNGLALDATLTNGTQQTKLVAGTAEIGNIKNSGTFAVQAAQSGTWQVGSSSATGSAIPTNAFMIGMSDATNLQAVRTANLTDGGTSGTSLMAIGNYLYNGSTWDRAREIANATNSIGTGITASGLVAQLDDVSPTTITENQFGNLRMSIDRALLTASATTRIVVQVSSAQTASGSSSALTTVGPYQNALVTLNCTASSGSSPTLNVKVQISDDGGTTWYDLSGSSFTQLTGTGSQAIQITNFGDTIRAVWTITGSTPSFTFAVKGVFKT